MSSSSSHDDNEGRRINKQRLLDNLMGVNGLCNKYYHLKIKEGKTEFVFDIDDVKNQYKKEEDLKSRDLIKNRMWLNFSERSKMKTDT